MCLLTTFLLGGVIFSEALALGEDSGVVFFTTESSVCCWISGRVSGLLFFDRLDEREELGLDPEPFFCTLELSDAGRGATVCSAETRPRW